MTYIITVRAPAAVGPVAAIHPAGSVCEVVAIVGVDRTGAGAAAIGTTAAIVTVDAVEDAVP